MNELNINMKLIDMRALYPNIKATSKQDFINKVKMKSNIKVSLGVGNNADIKIDTELKEMQRKNKVLETVPQSLLLAMSPYTNCDCTLENYDYFMNSLDQVSIETSSALILATYTAFNERVKKSSCSSCLNNRINRLRKHYNSVIH